MPFWLLGSLTHIQLSADLPISALLTRAFDAGRIRPKHWFIVIVGLPIGIFALWCSSSPPCARNWGGPGGYPYSAERISALILAALATVVTPGWGSRTLASNGP